jgi:PAS domain S-box-containing protein
MTGAPHSAHKGASVRSWRYPIEGVVAERDGKGLDEEAGAAAGTLAALRESEALFQAMADSAPAPIWVTGTNGIEFANRALIDFSGLPAEALHGTGWADIIHPDDLPEVMARRASAWAGHQVYSFDARMRRADGEWRWLSASLKPRFDAEGRQIGFVGMALDVTDAKSQEAELRESEARFRAMADSAPSPVWVTDANGIEFVNKAFVEFAGRPREALTGEIWMEMIHPDEIGEVLARRTEAWRTGGDYGYDARFRAFDGAERWMRVSCRARLDGDGRLIGYVGMAVDITDAKRAEAALRESEERLLIALAAGALGDWAWDAETDMVTLSAQAGRLFGAPPGPVMTWARLQKLIVPEDAAVAAEAVEAAVRERRDYAVEYRLAAPEGGLVWIAAVGRPIYHADGRPKGMIGVVQEVSARKAAEEQLREDKRSLETLNRIGASLASELDLQRVVQMVTDAGVELSGAAFGAFFYNVLDPAGESYMLYTISGVDRSHFDKFPMPRNTAVFAPTFSGEAVVRSDDIRRDPRYGRNPPHHGMPEGHLPVTSYLAVPVLSRSGEVIGGLFFGHSEPGRFTERHEQLLVGIAGQAAIAIDNARLFEAAQREIGERRRAEDALRELNQSLEARIAAAIAERERAEEALRQSQKMEAVGQLTGGIAHDFNNLLTVIAGNVDVARRQLGDAAEPRVLRALGNALVGAERAATLTQRLLAFSRRQPLNPRPIDVNRLVTGMSELLHRTLGETIAVETLLAADLWQVEVDPNQLENAILNLAVNARDAMPHGGKLTIETMNAQVEREAAGGREPVAPGPYVALTVSDIGSGMDADTLARAFEPFFTTKEVGKGTGLGLSMVYGFVRQSGGHVQIHSAEGQGTSVRICLPRLAGEAAAAEERAEPAAPEGAQGETILVCEDDDDVRAYTVEMLRELGYRVLEAHDAPAALRLLERQEARFDLLFTDVVLPGGMTGAELARAARALRPGLRILFTTGYARDAIVHHGRLDAGVELIAKPFAYAELAARVREMLDRA